MGSLFALIWFLLIGLVAGWLAGQFMKGRSLGTTNNMIVGVLGAVFGGFLIRLAGFSADGMVAELITATAGAVLVLYLLSRYGRRL
ncbi:MAG: GlsB/YeaQ/YmgE family stress response membrane protein [Paludisphaera borealis]|uniref:GlsB/YeaQ/YmgE family stress response membrane protein n=1 Tax=Paludisphaera borealis TaxID=1387353 RepID=UPI002845CF55|nr:GlsB/YeaQ/YmgE family stress response membrane protein [Paludisphaera borealis]MDR3620982.1 GlsB/YeaQ/YmgE family stress response membrane protein [Paludisphaera borealis]